MRQWCMMPTLPVGWFRMRWRPKWSGAPVAAFGTEMGRCAKVVAAFGALAVFQPAEKRGLRSTEEEMKHGVDETDDGGEDEGLDDHACGQKQEQHDHPAKLDGGEH